MYRLRAAEYRADVDPRELAVYTPADAAHFLGIPVMTLSNWLYGRGNFLPIIQPADPGNRLLSFYNLAEAHVLASTRYQHKVSFSAIRAAIETLRKKYPSPHPLISKDFFTTGKDLFIKTVDENENLSTPGQMNLKPIMDLFLVHIGRDKNKLAERVYPVIKGQPNDKAVTIINGVASGQPILSEYGVPVFVIYGRYNAGESEKSIAKDFGIPEIKVKRAIEYAKSIEKKAA